MQRVTTTAAAAAILMAGVAMSVEAAPLRSAWGAYGGLSWQAQSTIVGVTSAATLAGGGDSRYFAAMPKYSGVAALIMDYGPGGKFICSGSLLPDRRSILTAAHCVSDGTAARPIATTAYFYGGPDPDTLVAFNPLSTAVGVSQYFVHASYTGNVIGDSDIAVLRLANEAPGFAAAYGLYTAGDLTTG